VLYRPIDLKALVRASSQGTLRTEEVAHFGSTNDMDYHLLSMDSEEFHQTAELLSTVSCRKKLNQNYSAYTHDTFPVQSVTVSFYDEVSADGVLRRRVHPEQRLCQRKIPRRRRSAAV